MGNGGACQEPISLLAEPPTFYELPEILRTGEGVGVLWESFQIAVPRLPYYNACYNYGGVDHSLRAEQLKSVRTAAGLTQHQAADRLGVSQAYLALLERGRRRVTKQLQSRMVDLYQLGPVGLPLDGDNLGSSDSSSLAAGLASLGYPGFRQLTGGQPRTPPARRPPHHHPRKGSLDLLRLRPLPPAPPSRPRGLPPLHQPPEPHSLSSSRFAEFSRNSPRMTCAT